MRPNRKYKVRWREGVHCWTLLLFLTQCKFGIKGSNIQALSQVCTHFLAGLSTLWLHATECGVWDIEKGIFAILGSWNGIWTALADPLRSGTIDRNANTRSAEVLGQQGYYYKANIELSLCVTNNFEFSTWTLSLLDPSLWTRLYLFVTTYHSAMILGAWSQITHHGDVWEDRPDTLLLLPPYLSDFARPKHLIHRNTGWNRPYCCQGMKQERATCTDMYNMIYLLLTLCFKF